LIECCDLGGSVKILKRTHKLGSFTIECQIGTYFGANPWQPGQGHTAAQSKEDFAVMGRSTGKNHFPCEQQGLKANLANKNCSVDKS
jgi:hypothetical protein